MELKWPWLLLALPVLVLALVAWWSRRPRPRPGGSGDALLVAHAERLRALPRYRALVARQALLTGYRSVAVLVVCAGAILLAARPQSILVEDPEERSRDIMLCLDASGSMADENVRVVREMRTVVEGLSGERIGLTLFSGAAVTVFPLTDDYAFVVDQLGLAQKAFSREDYEYVAGTYLADEVASQLGDGIVSCAQRFDRPGEERGRAIIVASDNDPIGPPVFTIPEAAAYAEQRDIVVHGVGSPDLAGGGSKRSEFEDAIISTGGIFALLGDDGSAETIVDRIQTLEEQRIEAPPVTTVRESPVAGTVVAGLGLGLLALGWLAEAWLTRRRTS